MLGFNELYLFILFIYLFIYFPLSLHCGCTWGCRGISGGLVWCGLLVGGGGGLAGGHLGLSWGPWRFPGCVCVWGGGACGCVSRVER